MGQGSRKEPISNTRFFSCVIGGDCFHSNRAKEKENLHSQLKTGAMGTRFLTENVQCCSAILKVVSHPLRSFPPFRILNRLCKSVVKKLDKVGQKTVQAKPDNQRKPPRSSSPQEPLDRSSSSPQEPLNLQKGTAKNPVVPRGNC